LSETIALIGFGEAGACIGRGLAAEPDVTVRAYDIRFSGNGAAELTERAAAMRIAPHAQLAGALEHATLVFSAVVGSAAVDAAVSAAPLLRPTQAFVDLNSVSPKRKRAIDEAVRPSGVLFIEAAVMARVPLHGHRVPMLLAGFAAESIAKRLNAIGMKTEAVGDQIGQASANKMLRSIMVKGIEALLIECLVAARRCGIEERILDSVSETFPGFDWREAATYYLGRTALHGARRVTEMNEVAETLGDLNLEPIMATAIAKRIGSTFELLRDVGWNTGGPASYHDILDAIEQRQASGSEE